MIRIDRGKEPPALVVERSRRLASACIDGRPQESADFVGYNLEEVRSALLEAQRHRCAYCELPIDLPGYPIEHFRPKTHADDVHWSALTEPEPADHGSFFAWFERCFGEKRSGPPPWVKDKTRYWWLAWSWENLFFACPACNSATCKGNKFPLKRRSARLAEWEELPGKEEPLLLNPATVDPLDHVRFGPDLTTGAWGPIPLDDLGRWTIAVLGLNRRQACGITGSVRLA